jgi:hypothetical protein
VKDRAQIGVLTETRNGQKLDPLLLILASFLLLCIKSAKSQAVGMSTLSYGTSFLYVRLYVSLLILPSILVTSSIYSEDWK